MPIICVPSTVLGLKDTAVNTIAIYPPLVELYHLSETEILNKYSIIRTYPTLFTHSFTDHLNLCSFALYYVGSFQLGQFQTELFYLSLLVLIRYSFVSGIFLSEETIGSENMPNFR